MPKISVIIPVYNVEKYLKECLDSVVKQTLDDIEIICINDGSTDNSLNILKEYASNDARFVIIDKENTGQGDSRNIGMDRATGEYIAFLDGDDWLDLNAFKIVYEVFKNVNTDVIHFNYTIYNNANQSYDYQNFARETLHNYNYDLNKNPYYNIKLLRNNCFIQLNLYSWLRIYSKKFLDKYNLKFASTKNGEDQLFVNAVLLNADNIYYLNQNLYYYRIRENSTVRNKNSENFCIFDSVNIFKNYLIENNFYDEYKNEFEKYKTQVYAWCYYQIPNNEQDKYIAIVKNNLDRNYYKQFKKKIGLHVSFIQNILSVKNEYFECNKYKIFRFLFFKWRLKCKC